jgi:hypothetical protein
MTERTHVDHLEDIRDDLADSTAWVRRTRQQEWGPKGY